MPLHNNRYGIDKYGQNIRWNSAFGYVVWDKKKWVINKDTLVEHFAWLTIRGIYRDAKVLLEIASNCPNKEYRESLSLRAEHLNKHARNSENANMIVGMLKLARHRVELETDAFDTHQYLFNFNNGTLNTQTGDFYRHRREDYLTLCSPFNYSPHATMKLIPKFLDDITLGNKGLQRYLQKTLGYGLTSNSKEEVWFLWLGKGENGKTTLGDLYAYALGEYATRIDEKTISVVAGSSRDGASASPDIARLKGKRVGIVAETEEGTRAASSRLKDMATGEEVTARYLNKNNFTFRYTHKLIVYTNHNLVVHDNSHAFWRRVRRIPFNWQVPEDEKDQDLIYKLHEEVEGFLAWLVQGEMLRQKEGLAAPEIVQRATQEYRESQDVLGQFIRRYYVVDKNESVAAGTIQAKFKVWLEEEMNMKKGISMPTFRRMMEDHGFPRKHTNHGELYAGIREKTPSDYEQEHNHDDDQHPENSERVRDGERLPAVPSIENPLHEVIPDKLSPSLTSHSDMSTRPDETQQYEQAQHYGYVQEWSEGEPLPDCPRCGDHYNVALNNLQKTIYCSKHPGVMQVVIRLQKMQAQV